MLVRFSGHFTFTLPQGKTVDTIANAYHDETQAPCIGVDEENGKTVIAVVNAHDDIFKKTLGDNGITQYDYIANTAEQDAKLTSCCKSLDGCH
jgi:hypothetical protein